MQQMRAAQQQAEHWQMHEFAKRQQNAVKSENTKPKKAKRMAKKFYQIVDADGDNAFECTKNSTIDTLEEAIELAEKRARDDEEDYIIMVGLKVVGVPKSPVEVADL